MNESRFWDIFKIVMWIFCTAIIVVSSVLNSFDAKKINSRIDEIESEINPRIDEIESKITELTCSIDQLKPCPLCGSEVKISSWDFSDHTSYHIQCPECELETNIYYSKKELIDYWNRRETVNEN